MKRYQSFLMLLLATTWLPIKAQNVIHPKIAGPNDLWVNSFNGTLFFGRTDMTTQNSAMPMKLRFYYNSSRYATDYGFGLGFSLEYEMRYKTDDNGNVTIETGDGRADTYKRYGTDYEAPAGVFDILTRLSDGTYTLTDKNGMVYCFADTLHRKLTAVNDRCGNQTKLIYTDSLLTEIKDAAGHSIKLAYTNGLLTSANASFHPGSIKYEYDAKRRLKKVTDAMGYSILYAYNQENRIETVTNANGFKTMMAYNTAGMCSRIKTDVTDKSIRYDGDKTVCIDYTQPKNNYSYYRWDNQGRAIEKNSLNSEAIIKLEYDDDDNIIKRIDANGGMYTYTYDDRGNMLSATDALGNTEHYTYDDHFNQITSYQDKGGNSYRMSYDDKGNLTSITGPEGFSKAFTYNSMGWLTTATDANKNVVRTTYNADGTIATLMDAAGYTQSFKYDEHGYMAAATDARSQTTYYQYDENGRITAQTDALGNTTTLSYDKAGNVVRVKNAAGHITAYTYNAVNQIISRTDALGQCTKLTYDGMGNIQSLTDALGQCTNMTYGENNKLHSTTNPAGETTSYAYDKNGNLTSVFLPNGNVIKYKYDQANRILASYDNIGVIAQYTYDNNGNILSITDGENRTVSYAYDTRNRKVRESLPSGATTTYGYDNNSNLISVTDAQNQTTNYTYSSRNLKLTETTPLQGKTQFEYDGNGNLVKVIDARNNATQWTYDALNRNTQISFANGSTLKYQYDVMGNVIGSIDRAGNQTTYIYDAIGLLQGKTYADNEGEKFAYNALGQLLQASNKNATVSFTYDQAGRVTSETLNEKTISYQYDIAAGVRSYTYPSGMKVEEHLNARNQIAQILQNGNEAVNMAYNTAGQKISQTYANGITTHYLYQENGWPAKIKDNAQILNLNMSYDALGNMTERTDSLNGKLTETYGYDALAQVVSFKRGSTLNNSYQFDLVGNRTKAIENGITTTYTASPVNAYTNIQGGLSFIPQYDDNGNLVKDNRHNYQYDQNNRLVAVDQAEGKYAYDALGRRISKTTADGTYTYYYIGNQMIEEYMDGNVNASYLYGNRIDEILQMKKKDKTYYFHTNHLGSTMAITDGKKALTERVTYDLYGQPTFTDAQGKESNLSSVNNTILFTGREYDYESGTYHFRARSLDPQTGRFMQHDPLLYIDGMNDYRYGYNNPISFTDPTGTVVPLVIWGAVLIGANIGAWSTWFDNGTFSPTNTTGMKAFYGGLKGGLLGGIGAWNPLVGGLLSANFAGWESYYNEDCNSFSPDNTTSGEVAKNMIVDGIGSFIGGKIGGMNNWSLAKKGLADFLNGFYTDYINNTAGQIMNQKPIEWQNNANSALTNGAVGSLNSNLGSHWNNGVDTGVLHFSKSK